MIAYLLVLFLFSVRSDIPQCYHYIREHTILSGSFGAYDIRLDLNTQSMISAGEIATCSELRFRQKRTGLWLPHWFESDCNDVHTRVWVTVSFIGTSEVVEMFYRCRLLNGDSTLPPGGYGDPISWGGRFYVLSEGSCSDGWSDSEDAYFQNRYIKAVHTPNKAQYPGNMVDHSHSMSTPMPGASTTCMVSSGGIQYDHSPVIHHHLLSVPVETSNGKDTPWYYTLRFCWRTTLNMKRDQIVPLSTNFMALSGCFSRFSDAEDKGYLMGRTTPKETGGDEKHKHKVRGAVAVATETVSGGDAGGTNCALRTHLHQNMNVDKDTDEIYLVASHTDTVYAQNACNNADDYTGGMVFFMDGGLPPKGWRYASHFDGVFLDGRSSHSAYNVPANPHVHTSQVMDLGKSEEKFKYCGDGGTVPVAGDDHRHSNLQFISDDDPSIDDQYRVEIALIQYKFNYKMFGISPGSIHALECDGHWWGDTANVCSGRGICDGYGNCTCNDPLSWAWPDCAQPVCFGVNPWESHVCSRRGFCSAPDLCTCTHPDWGGIDCTIPKCDGILATDPDVCNRNGTCDGGACVCTNPDYVGAGCNIPKCFGRIAGLDPRACNGEGVCIAANDCDCTNENSYRGEECDIPVCDGYVNGDPEVCNNGNGTCMGGFQTAPYCSCGTEYVGPNCDIPVCFGHTQGTIGVCNGAGICIAHDDCLCTGVNYVGPECTTPVCDGFPAGDGRECNGGNGTCLGGYLVIPYCDCGPDPHYTGRWCDQPVCFGLLKADPTVCSGEGWCQAYDDCLCFDEDRYRGERCDVPVCNGFPAGDGKECNLQNGTCIGMAYGDNPRCTCSAPTTRYFGPDCEFPVCFGRQQGSGSECFEEGWCQAYDDCLCYDYNRFRGQMCDVPVCNGYAQGDPRVCNDGNGTCNGLLGEDPHCDCDRHHYGGNCELDWNCYGHWWFEPDVCTEYPLRGQCYDEDDNCVCNTGYSGDECEHFVCNLISGDDPGVCSGHGDCVEVDDCDCISTWTGDWCEEKVQCGGYDFDNPLVCRQRGVCEWGVCDCDGMYGGDDCEVTTCFEIASNSEWVCGSRPDYAAGICWDVDMCMCFQKHYGRECQEYFPVSTVLISGLIDLPTYEFFIPYVPPWDSIPETELPIGTPFPCNERFFFPESAELVGEDAFCRWFNGTDDDDEFTGVFVNISGSSPIVEKRNMKHELEITLLTSESSTVFGGLIDVSVKLTIPKGNTEIEGTFFTPFVISIFAGSFVFIILLAVLVVGIGCCLFCYGRKQNADAQEKLFAKIAEMENVSEMFAQDREKLELALRLQKQKSDRPEHLPESFEQLKTLDDDSKVVLLEDMGSDKVWRRCLLRRAVWQGHGVISRKLDVSLSAVTRRCVNSLIARATKWSEVPPHPRIRKFHAYFVEGLDYGIIKAVASGPKLLQAFAEKIEVNDKAPDHAILIEPLPGARSVLLHMLQKRRDAKHALPGVTIRSAVVIEEKLRWLTQAAEALDHLHAHGLILKNFNIHNLLVSEEDIKLDMPFLTRPAARSAFAAPEVVADSLGRPGEPVGAAADVYSFSIVMYCVFAETGKPYGMFRRRLKAGETVGERVSRDPKFRPCVHPWLPAWSGNVLRRCWAHDPKHRMTMSELYQTLIGLADVFSVADDMLLMRDEADDTGSDAWLDSDSDIEKAPLLGVVQEQEPVDEDDEIAGVV